MNKIFRNYTSYNLVVIVLLLIIWFMLSSIEPSLNPIWFAEIGETSKAIMDIFLTKHMHVYFTFKQILVATSIVILLGVCLGIIIGFFEIIYRSTSWTIDFWRSVPPVVIIFILVGIDESVDGVYWKIWLVIFGTLPIMMMQIADSIRNASESRMLIFEALSTGVIFKIKHIIIYEILPSLFSTTRTVISFAVIIVIVGDMVYSTSKYGIGIEILNYQTSSETPYVYAYAVVVGIIGFLLNSSIRYLEKKIVFWK